MITKSVAAEIWTAYNEIDQAEKMLEEMKKNIDEKGEFQVMVDSWSGSRRHYLELHIPKGTGSYAIKQLPFDVALSAIENHIKIQNEKLESLKSTCKLLLA